MVKRRSSLASNEEFRVRVLVGAVQSGRLAQRGERRHDMPEVAGSIPASPIHANTLEGLPDRRRDPLGKRASDEPCGFDSRPFRCVRGVTGSTPACEAGGPVRAPPGTLSGSGGL